MAPPNTSLFSYETLVHALAGATGSVASMAAFYPLDTLRSRLQVEDSNKYQGSSSWELLIKLANEEGIESLYRGLAPVLQSLSISNFVYFYTFHALRRTASTNSSAIQDLMYGIAAGSINVLITSPLWVVNTRMKLENNTYNSLFEGLITLFKKEGVKGLWSGTVPSLLLVSNPAIQFMVYEALKRHLVSTGHFKSYYAAFLVGAFAKAIATTVTYPLQLVQMRLRSGTSMKPLFKDVKSNPWLMFRGLEAKLLQTVMTAALMFLIYEKLVKLVFSIMRVRAKHS
ncbi:peroxisomal membrane protein PMP34 isoform X1 [Cydia pomonella]|uniref:peroxisomal membrane protein PMP34 isoform X1 n=1 Tax=Cydia pomonella TaxID=82600 RepID=UPI002ADE4587|nr:peroxisomal membrane protein PMP34 isoform X1 [Cydia pomonella]